MITLFIFWMAVFFIVSAIMRRNKLKKAARESIDEKKLLSKIKRGES